MIRVFIFSGVQDLKNFSDISDFIRFLEILCFTLLICYKAVINMIYL